MGADDFLPRPDDEVAIGLLARCKVFRRCPVDDLAALAAAASWRTVAPGADLVREGDPPTELYVIASGRARVLKRGADGTAEHEINRVGPDDAVGEMALFDRAPRSATVRATEQLGVLALPLDAVAALARQRPGLVPMLMDLGVLVAERLRHAAVHAAAIADRQLAEERTRAVMGRFTLLLMAAYTLYTWLLGTAFQVKQAFGGRSEFVTVPAVLICCAILFAFVKISGYPLRFFGLSYRHAARHVREALLFTLPWLVAAVGFKALLIATWAPMAGEPLFAIAAADGRFDPWLALAYVLFAPFQELIYRGGIQGPLSHFLIGRWRQPLAIVGANIIFSAAHLYVSPGLAAIAFVTGLFWGWLYARQGTLVGVSVSHVLLGFWAFEVVGLGALQ